MCWRSDSVGTGKIRFVSRYSIPGILKKKCSGWWLADRPSAVTLLYYAYTIMPKLEMFSFASSYPRCRSGCLSGVRPRTSLDASPPTSASRSAHAPRAAAMAQGVCKICDLRVSGHLVCMWWSKECGTTSYPKRPSLDSSCGVAKEAEPSETERAHVTSPNWCRF